MATSCELVVFCNQAPPIENLEKAEQLFALLEKEEIIKSPYKCEPGSKKNEEHFCDLPIHGAFISEMKKKFSDQPHAWEKIFESGQGDHFLFGFSNERTIAEGTSDDETTGENSGYFSLSWGGPMLKIQCEQPELKKLVKGELSRLFEAKIKPVFEKFFESKARVSYFSDY